ncbi:hypothetical protein LP7551_05383 [Roseibium album]|nr:hypothetical protein LP7551_05383 [Roseibium album]
MNKNAMLKPFSRRDFLAALGGLAVGQAFTVSTLAESLLTKTDGDASPLFASAYQLANGDYGIGIVDDLGQMLARISLPGRGHGVAVSPDRTRLVAFARRPGTFAVVIRPFENRSPEVVASETGRHFFGHGCFSADSRLLYAVENDFAASRGVIGIYDLSGHEITRIGEFDAQGIGPHEALLSSDGRTLVVANGGIETHPDKGREKLNLDTMEPSVVFLDVATGGLRTSHALDPSLHQLSLRHMALDAKGRAWVGGQFEGPEDETPPLVAVFSQDDAPKLLATPNRILSNLKNYIGSVTANVTGDVIATSAPRGGQVLFWNVSDGRFLGSQAIVDGCGVAPIDLDSFLVSDGNGALSFVKDPTLPAEILARPPGISWDNHMAALS